MSTLRYAYLFSGAKTPLDLSNVIQNLDIRGLEFDDELFELEVFPDGHLEAVGQGIKISKPVKRDLIRRVSQNQQIQATCRNKELFVVCGFATAAANPHIFFGWPARLFSLLDHEAVEEYRSMIQRVASSVKASYVIFVEDPPDYFEDHFLDVDGIRYLDVFLPSGGRHSIIEVWTQEVDSIIVEGIKLEPFMTLENGFHAFSVTETD